MELLVTIVNCLFWLILAFIILFDKPIIDWIEAKTDKLRAETKKIRLETNTSAYTDETN